MNTTEGIVLKRTDSGEADSIFAIYTKDFGKIKALAQGIKKGGAKLKGHLEPPALSIISFVRGRNGDRLTGAAVIEPYVRIKENLDGLLTALRVLHIVDRDCFPGERDEAIWRLLHENLHILEHADGASPHLYKSLVDEFAIKLSAQTGYAGADGLI